MLESPQSKKAKLPPRMTVGAQNAQKPRAQAPRPAARAGVAAGAEESGGATGAGITQM